MDAVRGAVQNGITQLGQHPAPTMNSQPGGAYAFPARSREELIQDSAQAASSRQTDQKAGFDQLRDPAVEPVAQPQAPAVKADFNYTEDGWLM